MDKRDWKRHFIFPVVAVGMGFILCAVGILAIEVALRFFKVKEARPKEIRISKIIEPNVQPEIANRYRLRVHSPQAILSPWSGKNRASVISKLVLKEDQTPDMVPGVGRLYPPGSRIHANWATDDGSFSQTITYSIDSEKRREVSFQNSGNPGSALLFLGCSFTFGKGLNDEETLPSQVAKLRPPFHTYNYGHSGWGPSNILKLLEMPGFGSDLSKKGGGRAVYVFIDSHISRMLGALDIYRASRSWAESFPYFFLDSQGALQSQGMVTDRPFLDPLYTVLSQSKLLRLAQVEIPPTVTKEHIRLFVAMMKQLQQDLVTRMNGMKLTIAIYPGTVVAPALIPFLDKAGIESLDYSRLDIASDVDGPTELPDGHPSAQLNHFLAQQILNDLLSVKN